MEGEAESKQRRVISVIMILVHNFLYVMKLQISNRVSNIQVVKFVWLYVEEETRNKTQLCVSILLSLKLNNATYFSTLGDGTWLSVRGSG